MMMMMIIIREEKLRVDISSLILTYYCYYNYIEIDEGIS